MTQSLRHFVLILGLVFLLVLLGIEGQDYGKLSSANYLTPFKRGWKVHHSVRHRGMRRNGMHPETAKWYTGLEHSKIKRRHGGKMIP